MAGITYVNGRYLPSSQAQVAVDDRGYQFADGIYEVIPVSQSVLLYWSDHMERLRFSLGELSMAPPVSAENLFFIAREIVSRNKLAQGYLYVQITRGVAHRDHPFPENPKSALVVTAFSKKPFSEAEIQAGVQVLCMADERWTRPDIKSIGLLPNVLAKQKARSQGAFEAWLLDANEHVTEGSSSNAWIITQKEEILTRQADQAILAGITRKKLLSAVQKLGYNVVERAFSLTEALQAKEAFLTSSGVGLLPITRIQKTTLGNGAIGPITRKLWQLHQNIVKDYVQKYKNSTAA